LAHPRRAHQENRSSRPIFQQPASHINKALKSADIGDICRAMGDATRLHNISDIARKAGIERPSAADSVEG
jgi:DNA-binding phage protein